MGCAPSKKVGATVLDVYRPPPTSFAAFDINAIEEPWLKLEHQPLEPEKPAHVPVQILQKLDVLEQQGPRAWDEVSKALESLKPSLHSPAAANPPQQLPMPAEKAAPPEKSLSFHTIEELDEKLSSSKRTQLRKTESLGKIEHVQAGSNRTGVPGSEGYSGVRANPFIVRDRVEREKEGKAAVIDKILMSKRDPLGEFPEKCPRGGAQSVVLYTTSLGGVRRTYEDCNRVRAILETHRVVFDERDVALHGEFRAELKAVLGEQEAAVPRLFVKGRYLGGAVEVVEMNDTGKLARVLSGAKVERGVGWQGCEGCGGARFVPCLDCGGSCKVVISEDNKKERCPKCNENGLVPCPLCH